jgi:outer membrane protein assembly factor BamB
VLAVTLLILLGTSFAAGQDRERQRLLALAQTRGFVAPLDTPLHEIWRTGTEIDFAGELYSAGGLFVGVGAEPDRRSRAVGLDPVTGTTLWHTELGSPSYSLLHPTCVVPDPADVVVCLSTDRTFESNPALDGSAPAASLMRTRLMTIDAASGVVRQERDVDQTATLVALGTDVVVVQIDGNDLRMTRLDPRTNRDRWTVVGALQGRSFVVSGRVSATADAVFISTYDQAWEISADGAQVRERHFGTVADSLMFQPVADGRVVLWSLRFSDGDSDGLVLDSRPGSGTWSSDGRLIRVDGFPVVQTIDDGTAPGLVFSGSLGTTQISAWNLTSLDLLWTDDLDLRGVPAVVDGHALVTAADGLHVLDARTGHQKWATSLPSPSAQSFITDGTAVAVLEELPGGHREIRVYGLDDGQRWWSVSVSDDVEGLVEHGGHVFGVTKQSLVAYG